MVWSAHGRMKNDSSAHIQESMERTACAGKPGQTMSKDNPLFDQATHYQIEVQGRVDAEWLQSFDSAAEIIVDETGQIEDITVLNVHTDQAGIVGLVRRLHGLGMMILKIQIVSEGAKAAEVQEGR
jgi:hypothetical protein